MNAPDALRMLAAGQRPDDALLPPVRLFAGGAEYFGEEAVIHAFRRAPLILSEGAETIQTDGHIAIFEGDNAMFAVLYGDRIARIWHMGTGEPGHAEPMIGVPFDTDLRQSRRDVAFRAKDHPALAEADAQTVESIGRQLAHGGAAVGKAYRTRPFVIQAFTGAGRGAALFATHRLGGETVRSTGFSFVGAAFHSGGGDLTESRVVHDFAGLKSIEQRPWRTGFV